MSVIGLLCTALAHDCDERNVRGVSVRRCVALTRVHSSGGLQACSRRRDLGQTCEREAYSGPANDFLCLSDVRTAKIAASVRCFIPIFNKRFET